MKCDIKQMKKKRKNGDPTLITPVKKKKSRSDNTAETNLVPEDEPQEIPEDNSQEQPQSNGHKKEKKEKKKKRKVNESTENLTGEKKAKINDDVSGESKILQNGAATDYNNPNHLDNKDEAKESDNDLPEASKISNKEASKLSGKSFRKSFNSREGLDALRKFVTICKENEQRDLASEYLQAGGSVLEILRLLDTSDKKNINNACTVFTAMHVVIMKILSEFPQYQSNAEEACRHFINSHLSFVHSMLSAQSNAKHRKIVLRLLASMVSLGGSLPRELLGHLSFHSQVLDTLSEHTKPTDSQSVRTCFIHFVLAFLIEGNPTIIRALLDKRGMLSCIFPELVYDSHATVNLVLDTVKTYVLENQAISKTSKLYVFSTPVLQSLVSLYNWKGPKNWPGPKGKKRDTSKDVVHPEEKEVAVEAVHNFLITLLTSNRHGVIFHDRTLGTSGRKYNQLVNTVLQSLDRPWEHPRPLDLVVRVLVACPDLVRSQLTYTEPFLEPRASKKWILAMRFVGKIVESLDADACLKPCLSELSGSRLISAVVALTIPTAVLKNTIVRALNDDNRIIRHEAVILLTKMFTQVKAFTAIVANDCHEPDSVAFKHAMTEYISKNAPSLESIFKVWTLALQPETKTDDSPSQEDVVEDLPQRHEHFTAILDLLEIYREVCSERLDIEASSDFKPADLLTNLNDLPEVEQTEICRMKVKALRFLLSVDLTAFAPSKPLFGETLSFLISVLDETGTDSRKTIKMLLTTSGMFEGCTEQIDIWINGFVSLDEETERIKVANWFVKVVQNAIKKTDKYLGLILEAEEVAGEQTISAGRLEDIFNELCEKDSGDADSRIANLAPTTAISPLLCSALENIKKSWNETLDKYLSYVTILTLHCQVSPGTLIHLAKSVQNLSANKYLTSWLSGETPACIKKPFSSKSIICKFSKICLSNETLGIDKIFEGKRTIEFEHNGEKYVFSHGLVEYEVVMLLRISVFYLTQFMQRSELTQEQFDGYKSYIIALLHIAKDLSEKSNFVEECSQIIFRHPAILQYFSPICKLKNIIHKIVTTGLVDICQVVVDLNDEGALPELFLPFKSKMISQLRSAAKKCKNGSKLKNSLAVTNFLDFLRPTTQDIIDMLKTVMELSKENFLTDKNSLSIWGDLVPKLMELLIREKSDSEISTLETTLVRKIVSYLTQLKIHRKLVMDSWETNLLKYLENYPHSIAGVDGHAFNSLLKLATSSTTKLLTFLIGRNDQYVPLFVKFVMGNSKTLAQTDLILPILASNLGHNWNPEFLKKVHNHYKKEVTGYFADPGNDANWVGRNVKATRFLIDSCFDKEDCTKACETVLSNGDKLDNVDLGYVQLLETLFNKSSKLETSDEPLMKLVQVLVRITMSALKKDAKNEEKLETLCGSLCDTIELLKSRDNNFVFEDLNKNYSWPQFTRFSLKLGLKTSKEGKKHIPLLRTLVNVCDVAYKDASENEYVKTLFEMTTSHSEFVNLMLSSQSLKRDLLELLWVLVRKNHSTMASSQIPLYLAAYNATLSESDQFILLILQHYEANKIKFNEYRPYLWGEAAATHYSVKGEADTALWRQPSTSQVIDLFNNEMIVETIKHFPVHRDLKPLGLCGAQQVYDPSFYLPLLTYLLSDNNVVACHKVTQSGALALALAACGSSCSETRLAAYTAISRFYFHLEATNSKEKQLWVRYIDALRNGVSDLNTPLKEVRLSCLVSTFLARASLVTTQPMNVLYSPLQAFLMAKPAMELNAIPELLQLFHSSEIQHKAHRHWILEVIRDGLKTNYDMDLALKCVLFKMLLDFYTSVLSDEETKRLILQIILSTVKIPKAGLLLARSYGLLVWLAEISMNLDSRDLDSVHLVITIARESLTIVATTSDRSRDLQFLLLNVLKSIKLRLSKKTSVASYSAYTSALSEIIRTKSFRKSLSQRDMEDFVELGRDILGNVDDIADTLRHGGAFSAITEDSSTTDDATICRRNLRKLVLTWCATR